MCVIKVLEHYKNKNSKLLKTKLLIIKERNISHGRNTGAFQANGEIVAFTDADTLIPENWAQKIYDTFNSNKKNCRHIWFCFYFRRRYWEEN